MFFSAALAAPLTIGGIDPGVGPGGARPNSDAAAAPFDAAAGALGTMNIIDFEGLPVGDFASLQVFPGVTATLSRTAGDTDAGITNVVGSASLGYNTTGGGSQHLRFVPQYGVGTASLAFLFDDPIQAFGAYLTGLGTAAGNLHVVFDDGSMQDLSVTGNDSWGVQFFGFTDAGASIVQVDLELRNITNVSRDVFGVDDVRFVTFQEPPPPPTAVPEPTSVGVWLIAGLLGAAVATWRRRNYPG